MSLDLGIVATVIAILIGLAVAVVLLRTAFASLALVLRAGSMLLSAYMGVVALTFLYFALLQSQPLDVAARNSWRAPVTLVGHALGR